MYLKKRNVTLVGFIIMISMVFSGCGAKNANQTSQSEQKVPVTVKTVSKGGLEKSILFGGLLQPIEAVSLTAKNPTAKVLSVPVKVGDNITAGTPLVSFDIRDIELQYQQASLNYERNKALYQAGAISQAQLEQVSYTLDALKIGRESGAITSPITGIVSSVSAVEGQVAGAVALVTVVDVSRIKLQINIGENYINKILQGGEMNVVIPTARKEPFTGLISKVAPNIDERTKAYPITIEIDNPEGLLKGGMYGEVQLVVERKDDIVVIPQIAVLDVNQKKVVYVVENEKAKMKEVSVGLTVGDQAEIINGLIPGEQIIVEGQYGIKEDSLVNPTTRGEQK